MIKPLGLLPKGRSMTKKSTTVVTKQPSNSSTAGSMKSGKSFTQSPQPKPPKKPKAKIIGSSTKAIKKLNPSAKQTMRRPGLVTSKATGG